MKKKIIIAHNFISHSLSAMSKDLAVTLAEEGNEVVFISHSPKFPNATIHESGVKLYSWPEQRPTGFKSIWFAYQLIKKMKPDVVLAHMGSVNALMLAAFFCKVPLKCAYYHTTLAQLNIDYKKKKDGIINKLMMRRKLFVYRLCNRIFFSSQFSVGDFETGYKVSKRTKKQVINNAISDKAEALDTLMVRFEKPAGSSITIGFIGRLDPSKGVLETINAVKEFEILHPGKIKLRIAGSGNLAASIEKEIQGFPGIEMLGRLDFEDVYGYIKSCDYLICPSLVDNFPTVCLESLMLGVPVIGSNRGGIPEIIEDGKQGFILNGLETSDFIEVFTKAIQLNREEYQLLSEAARASYINRFSIPVYIDNMKKYLGLTA